MIIITKLLHYYNSRNDYFDNKVLKNIKMFQFLHKNFQKFKRIKKCKLKSK